MYEINRDDSEHQQAVNYDGTNYYHNPMTIDIDGSKFVLPFGSADYIYTLIDEFVTLISENSGLDCIACIVIDPVSKEVVQDVYIDNCSGSELTADIFDLDTPEQLDILGNWFQ